MAPETPPSDSANNGTGETPGGQQQEQQSTEETSGQDTGQQQQEQEGTKPDSTEGDKPKPDPQKQALQADLHKERKEHKASKEKVSALEAQVAELTPKAETADAIQARYDRLEAFLQAVGGPMGRALDSRSFTHALFETDQDIKDIVKKWHQDNPSATDTALGTKSSRTTGKVDPNELLRAAAGHTSS